MKLTGRTTELISELDSFWDTLSDTGLLMHEAINDYAAGSDRLGERLKLLAKTEDRADQLRREIKLKLYRHMLLPESRGDILGLLEASDKVIDRVKNLVSQLEIEKPDFPEILISDICEMGRITSCAITEMVKAARAFFREIGLVNDYVNKVYFYEKESDALEEMINRKIFSDAVTNDLSLRIYLRNFVEKQAAIADYAEAVCERLVIYSIKRAF